MPDHAVSIITLLSRRYPKTVNSEFLLSKYSVCVDCRPLVVICLNVQQSEEFGLGIKVRWIIHTVYEALNRFLNHINKPVSECVKW